jgi:TonB-dependent SusC/RagA subfamily outer membrane receptor
MRLIFLLLCILGYSCSPKQAESIKSESNELDAHDNGYTRQSKKYNSGSATTVLADPSANITLDNYLRKVPGVNVWNDGPNATITVRGVSSFNSGLSPLFIVNGSQVSGGFSSVYASVATEDIKSVTVLKDAASTAIYGTRGANGVIVITLKSASKK